MNLMSFLEANFLKLPKWARIIAYFLMMALIMYLLTAPRFINGQIVARMKNGGFVPYRGVELQTHVDGRTMKYQTNEDGYWSIPLVSRLPESVHFQVFHQDEGVWFPVVVDAADVWAKPWSNAFRVVILKDQPFVTLEQVARNDQSVFERVLAGVTGLTEAHAAGLSLPEQKRPQPAPPPPPMSGGTVNSKQKSIERSVAQAYRQVTGAEAGADQKLVVIGARSKLSYVQRIQLVQLIEQSQQLRIPDQHWKSFETLAELSNYVYQRKLLEATNPQLYGKQQLDWGKVNAELPPEQKPRFLQTSDSPAAQR